MSDTILHIAGLDVGNDEELTKVLDKLYRQNKRISILEVNEQQLEFIGDCYEVYGRNENRDGKSKTVIFFDPGYNEMELRIEGEDD